MVSTGRLRSLRCPPQALCSHWFRIRQFEISRLIGIRPYNGCFSGLLAYSSLYFSSPSRTILLVLCRVSVSRRFSISFSSSGAFITGRLNPFHMMGVVSWEGHPHFLIHGVTVENTHMKMVNKHIQRIPIRPRRRNLSMVTAQSFLVTKSL